MTAVDKAKELVDRFKGVTRPFSKRRTLKVDIHPEHAKQCALICVDEIINATEILQEYLEQDGYMLSLVEFYTEVKQEINKL